jgi:hypothetical protein
MALLVGCKQQPARHQKISDAELRQMRVEMPGITDDCLEKIKWGGIQAAPAQADQCFKFEKPRRWKGIWINQFERQRFCPNPPERSCPKNSTTNQNYVWLEFASEPSIKPGSGGVYELEFIGRRSVGAGVFGHFGMSPNEIIVDHIISLREVEAPPPPATKAEIEGLRKACLANHTCRPNIVPNR